MQQRSDSAQLDSQLQRLLDLVLGGQTDITALVNELNSAITTRIDNVALGVKYTVANDGQATRNHITKLDSSAAARIDNSTSAVTSAVFFEAVATRDHFDTTFHQAERRQRDERDLDQELKSFDKLLHSVQSISANIRQVEVADTHATTFEWVFDPGELKDARYSYISSGLEDDSRDDSRKGKGKGKDEDKDASETHVCNKFTDIKMDCFVCWLGSPQAKPYWVCGKPGSGKSTLMKYIARSPRTRSILENIYGRDTVILSHFIYLHGQKDQHSRRGILLSLSHQYLSRISGDAAKIQLIQGIASVLQHQIPDIFVKGASSEWSYGELEAFLLAILEDSQRKVMIFIDGLDEVEVERQEGSPSPVLSLIDKLCRLPQAHVCVSSRPEKVFVDNFAKGVHLTLQELTQHDISEYIADHFRQIYAENKGRRRFLEHLVYAVLNRSQGVFLWACIVTKNLAEALRNGDDNQMVEERLEELPRDINDLYQAMHQRLKDDHKRYQLHASTYLQAVLRDKTDIFRRGQSAITDLLPEHQIKFMLEKIIRDPKCRYTWARSECEKLGKVVPLRTFYLVEVGGCSVRLLHRSAADFLETPNGQEILKHYKPSQESETALYLWRTLLFAALQRDAQDFLLALGGFIWHLEKNVFDYQPQLAVSLFLVCQRLYYSRMPHDSPSTLAFPGVLMNGYCFNSFLARLGVPRLLFCTMTVDIGSFKMTQGSLQNDFLSRRQLPLVYSPDYLLFLVYQSLVVFGAVWASFEERRSGAYYVNTDSDTYHWLLQNICVPAKPQQPLKTYISLTSVIATSIRPDVSESGTDETDIKALQAALLMEGAWDEKPICTLSLDGSDVWFDVYGFHQGKPTFTPAGEGSLVMQVTMGFLVYLFLILRCTSSGNSSISGPLASSLLAEIKMRYPSGIPPARVFAGSQPPGPDHQTRNYFTLSPDRLLHISMPRNPSETALTFMGKCVGVEILRWTGNSVGYLSLHGSPIRLRMLRHRYETSYKNTFISAQDIDGEEPGEDYDDGDKGWYNTDDTWLGLQSEAWVTSSRISAEELTVRSGFFEMSSVHKRAVNEKLFVQDISRRRKTTSNSTA